MQAQTEVRELMGMSVTDTRGAKVGTIKQVYLNDDSGAPEWVTVHTGWFGMRESFVPLAGAHKSQDTLQVPYDKETIKGAPNVNADEHLSHAQIVDLYRHYGVRPPGGRRQEKSRSETAGERGPGEEGETSAGGAGTTDAESTESTESATGTAAAAGAAGMPAPAGMAVRPGKSARGQTTPPQPAHEDAEAPMTEITRSEERMRIDTERHESGRVRVRKYVETEMVEQTIPVSHEEIKIDREPIEGGRPDPEITISEGVHEIILYEERPVVTKETVPVERVHVRTEQVQDQQTVRGELRRERIEVTREEGANADPETGRTERA